MIVHRLLGKKMEEVVVWTRWAKCIIEPTSRSHPGTFAGELGDIARSQALPGEVAAVRVQHGGTNQLLLFLVLALLALFSVFIAPGLEARVSHAALFPAEHCLTSGPGIKTIIVSIKTGTETGT